MVRELVLDIRRGSAGRQGSNDVGTAVRRRELQRGAPALIEQIDACSALEQGVDALHPSTSFGHLVVQWGLACRIDRVDVRACVEEQSHRFDVAIPTHRGMQRPWPEPVLCVNVGTASEENACELETTVPGADMERAR